MLEAALKAIGGKIEDKDLLMKTLRGIKVDETCRGPVQFDKYGNVVGNIYIRKVEKKGGALVNAVIKTYPNVSQFWTYDAEEFLKKPGLQSRDLAGEQEFGAVRGKLSPEPPGRLCGSGPARSQVVVRDPLRLPTGSRATAPIRRSRNSIASRNQPEEPA